jgi:hypothetical protein
VGVLDGVDVGVEDGVNVGVADGVKGRVEVKVRVAVWVNVGVFFSTVVSIDLGAVRDGIPHPIKNRIKPAKRIIKIMWYFLI